MNRCYLSSWPNSPTGRPMAAANCRFTGAVSRPVQPGLLPLDFRVLFSPPSVLLPLPRPLLLLLLLLSGDRRSTSTVPTGGSLPTKRGTAFRSSTIMRRVFGESFALRNDGCAGLILAGGGGRHWFFCRTRLFLTRSIAGTVVMKWITQNGQEPKYQFKILPGKPQPHEAAEHPSPPCTK